MNNELKNICNDLVKTSHQEHEELLAVIQANPHEDCVPFVARLIHLKPELEYLDYDDYGAFYKRCLRVLKTIGGAVAEEAIQNCALSTIPELKEQALYRLKAGGKESN